MRVRSWLVKMTAWNQSIYRRPREIILAGCCSFLNCIDTITMPASWKHDRMD